MASSHGQLAMQQHVTGHRGHVRWSVAHMKAVEFPVCLATCGLCKAPALHALCVSVHLQSCCHNLCVLHLKLFAAISTADWHVSRLAPAAGGQAIWILFNRVSSIASHGNQDGSPAQGPPAESVPPWAASCFSGMMSCAVASGTMCTLQGTCLWGYLLTSC